MKFLKGLLIFLLISFVIYCVVMLFLPSTYTLERKITIQAEPSTVYDVVVDFESWQHWSYWDKSDSTNVVTYIGEKGTVGSGYSWVGDMTGEGQLTITAMEEPNRIDFLLEFKGQDPATGYFTFAEISEGETEVTYGFTVNFGFFDRVFKAAIDLAVGPAFESSLSDLKAHVEAMKAAAPQYEVMRTSVSSMPYFGIQEEIAIDAMTSDYFASTYGEIMAHLGEDTVTVTAPPIAIYHIWDPENNKVKLTSVIVSSSAKAGTDRIQKGMTYSGDVLKVNYYGPYDKSEAAHMAIDAYLKANTDITMAGDPYEVYVTDPGKEPDPAKWLTEVYYPVAAVATADTSAVE